MAVSTRRRRPRESGAASDTPPRSQPPPDGAAEPDAAARSVLARMSALDRLLPVWIVVAMAAGLLLGRYVPGVGAVLDAVRVGQTSLPIAVGLLVMMYPVLAKVRYEDMGRLATDKRMLILSLVLNWVVGPALMFTLAWVFLPDEPALRTGLIVVGLARCIAMVLVWNDLALGDREAGALLVALNSLFQIAAYAGLGAFYLRVLPGWLGLPTQDVAFSTWGITKAVLIFLGIPLVAAFWTRRVGIARRGAVWYERSFLPRIGPFTLYGLLFTIVVMFALQGEHITGQPLTVARVALPLVCYFALMWSASYAAARWVRLSYQRTATVAFTAAGNNFELAIAVAVAVWGVTSGQALAATIGPLVEVPVLVGLVYVALWLRRRLTHGRGGGPAAAGQGQR